MSVQCCGKEAQWTTISPRISYWYCSECKQEVEEKNEKTPTTENSQLTQEEIDELFSGLPTPRNYDPDDDSDVYLKRFENFTFDKSGQIFKRAGYSEFQKRVILPDESLDKKEWKFLQTGRQWGKTAANQARMNKHVGVAGEDIFIGDLVTVDNDGVLRKWRPE